MAQSPENRQAKPSAASHLCRQLHWLLSCDDEAKWKCSGKKKINSTAAAHAKRLKVVAVRFSTTRMGANLIKGVYLVNQNARKSRNSPSNGIEGKSPSQTSVRYSPLPFSRPLDSDHPITRYDLAFQGKRKSSKKIAATSGSSTAVLPTYRFAPKHIAKFEAERLGVESPSNRRLPDRLTPFAVSARPPAEPARQTAETVANSPTFQLDKPLASYSKGAGKPIPLSVV